MNLSKLVVVIAAVLALAPTGCHARQRMLEAVVTQSGDLPCFSVERSGTRVTELEVAAFEVTELAPDGAVISQPWTAGLAEPMRNVTVSSDSCVIYGSVSNEQATPLRVGARYSLFINAFAPDGSNRRYQGYFCVGVDEAGDTVVRQVKWDTDTHARRWDVCGVGS